MRPGTWKPIASSSTCPSSSKAPEGREGDQIAHQGFHAIVVMAGLVPAIHVRVGHLKQGVDARVEPGHDGNSRQFVLTSGQPPLSSGRNASSPGTVAMRL